jgi:hypothetical protein
VETINGASYTRTQRNEKQTIETYPFFCRLAKKVVNYSKKIAYKLNKQMEHSISQVSILAYLQHDTHRQPLAAQTIQAKIEDLSMYLTKDKHSIFDFLSPTIVNELLFDKLIALRITLLSLLASQAIDLEEANNEFGSQLVNFCTTAELQNLYENIAFAMRTQHKIMYAQQIVSEDGNLTDAGKAFFLQEMPQYYKQYLLTFQLSTPQDKLKNLTLFFNYGLLLDLYAYVFVFLLTKKIEFDSSQLAEFSFLMVNTTQKYGGLARNLGLLTKYQKQNDRNDKAFERVDLQESFILSEQGMQAYAKQLTENE